jgi:cytochrome c oxidase subunit 2
MKSRLTVLTLIVLLVSAGAVFAADDTVNVGNKICPISGEKVGIMGPAVPLEYKGKVYNLCCAGCVATFKYDPEKHVKVVEEEMGKHKKMDSGDAHEGHQHVMGEQDGHVSMDAKTDEAHQGHEMTAPQTVETEGINLEAYKYGFSPERIVVKKGEIVKLLATSRDIPHGVSIKEYGINERVEPGKVNNIEFIADKAGEFDILCSVYCGSGHHSMKAKLIVE